MVSLGLAANIYTGTSTEEVKDNSGFMNSSSKTESKFSGTNFSIGALIDLNQFRLGATFKTPFPLNEKIDDQDFDADINMPKMLGIGLAYQATEALMLAADYEMRSYSNSTVKYNKASGFYQEGEEENLGWEDINQFRLGAEYLLMSGNNILPIRLGFATAPLPLKDSNDDQIVGVIITGGIGLIMGNINLDLGLEYNTYGYEWQFAGQKN